MDNTQKPKVKISDDKLKAYLYIPFPEKSGKSYSVDDLLLYLDLAGIEYGIETETIQAALIGEHYGEEILVARGKKPTEGEDGYYVYHFSQDFSHVPQTREDGTVDYRSIKTMEIVSATQKIANYVPAVMGENGMSVTGQVIPAKRSRELSPLRGRGFSRADDGTTYFADIDGKINVESDGRIIISPVHEVRGNAGIEGGNIDFKGDVIVHGDVVEGISIHATGSIVIDGVAEDCTLIANGEIIIKRGVKGAEKTSIFSKDRVVSEFIELAKVRAEGNVQADVFYNSVVFAGEKILLTGKKASVIGGKMWAVEGIECQNVGNEFGVNTKVQVGMDETTLDKMTELRNKVTELEEEISQFEKSLRAYDEAEATTGKSFKGDPKRMLILRNKLNTTGQLERTLSDYNILKDRYDRSRYASVLVHGFICPGANVGINELRYNVTQILLAAKFIRDGAKIIPTGIEEEE